MAVELQQQPAGGPPTAPAAAAATTTTALPLAQRILQPDNQPHFNFSFNDFLKREYRFGLDPSRPICNAFKQGHCPLGNACPDKHPTSSAFNKYALPPPVHWHQPSPPTRTKTNARFLPQQQLLPRQPRLQALAPRPLQKR